MAASRLCSYSYHGCTATTLKALSAWKPSLFLQKRRTTCPAHASRSTTEHSSDENPSPGTIESASTVRELKVALGIESPEPERNPNSRLDRLLDRVQVVADAVAKVTETETVQSTPAWIIFLFLPVWLLYTLVAAKAFELPFPLPFLDN